jgi:broad specificity phosphatase PhoE
MGVLGGFKDLLEAEGITEGPEQIDEPPSQRNQAAGDRRAAGVVGAAAVAGRPPVYGASAVGSERRVLVVAHGTLNRILLCVAMGVPVCDYRRRFVQDRVNLTVLRYEPGDLADGAQLVLGNDVAHLRGHAEEPWG